ncbi:MAG TPA: IPT/TIG domain-containing protein [Bryobacteraceae bacterium]|nr:IPT/TIG domain-containing protein [Bryobacteraceae bacterium]
MRLLPAVLLIALTSCSVFGQTYTISTFAGGTLPVNIPGTSASLSGTQSVAMDAAGNVFFTSGNSVLRLDAQTGILTLAAGNGTAGFSGDNGPATNAQLYNPNGVAVDSAGNLYIADAGNARIRRVSNGVITTVGNGAAGVGVAVDSTGNLYIADSVNNRVRKVSNGVVSTVAGNGTAGFGGDNGPATSAQLSGPAAVAVDSAGNLYIADYGNDRVRKVSNGVITTVAGNGTASSNGDNGPATTAQLSGPSGVAVDPAGNLYIAASTVRKVSNGIITTAAGGGSASPGDNGPATSALLLAEGVAVDSVGRLYIADSFNSGRIRRVSNGAITTVAGGGSSFGDKGPTASAQLYNPAGVAVDSAGNLYIADSNDYRVRKVANGIITTVAGNGTLGFSGDNGPASSAQLWFPYGVAVDSAGNMFIADAINNRVRKVSNGIITTVAGNGMFLGFSGDNGPAASAQLSFPYGVAVDSAGNLYIADYGNNRVRKVSNGIITTIAGNGTAGFNGDLGPATNAQLNRPVGVAVDSAGSLYIADTLNNRIRKVSNGVITTVAGGGSSLNDNGPAASAQLNNPNGVTVDSTGNLYIADTQNNRVRKVANGVITTIAGGGSSFGDNGPATSAQLAGPAGVSVDSAGNVYIGDTGENRIRLLTPPCTYSLTPTSLQAPAPGGNFGIGIQTASSCSWAVSGLPAWITVSGASSGAGPGTVTLVVASNASGATLNATISIASVSFPVTQTSSQTTAYTCTNSTPPVITSVNSASAYGGYSYFASGSWLEIKGTNLADPADPRLTATTNPGQWTSSDFNGVNAPTSLDGISVSINGKPAYVWYLSPTQLNVQAPEDSATGNVAITVANCKATSSPFTLTRLTRAAGFLAPANYNAGGKPYMVATFASDGAYVLNASTGAAFGLNSRPAKPGDLIIAYGIGFGDVTPLILPGVIVEQNNALVNPVTISFGSTNATLSYSGLAGSFVGLYEFYITVPPVLADGDYQVNVSQNGTPVPQTMYLTVHN